MNENIFILAEKILNTPANKSKLNEYKNIFEYRNIIYAIGIYLFKKYWIIWNITHNPENNKLVDFFINTDTEEIFEWSYELTQTYKYNSGIIKNCDFYILLSEIIKKKWWKKYIIEWKKWLIIHSYNMWVEKINPKEILDFFDKNREKINFDIIIFSCFIWDKKTILSNIYHKYSRVWYTIILQEDNTWKDINIIEDTKFYFEKEGFNKRIIKNFIN